MKNAVITGASSGIGLALSRQLGKRGYRLALLARRAGLLGAHSEALRSEGFEAMPLTCDVTDSAAVTSACQQVLHRWGSLDLAVANAGLGTPTPARRFVLEDAERVMTTNFHGMLNLYQAVIPSMLEQRSGTFVGVASLAGLRGMPGSSVYCASKAAMQTFLEAVRVELAPHGVAVSIVNPGFVATPMTEKNSFAMPFLMDSEKAAAIIARGLDRKARTIEFPLPMSMAMRTARLIPGIIYDRIFRSFGKVDRSSDRSRR